MTRRQLCRSARRHPVLVIAAGALALVAADVVLHMFGALIVAAAIGGAGYWLGRRARPAVKVTADSTELARLRAELDQARAELADAKASAAAAWDAAASVPSKTTRPAPGREQLLADPRAGVHDLGGGPR
jgi:hypothetical protein